MILIDLPEGLRLVDAFDFNYSQRVLPTAEPGYYKSNVPDDDDAERAFASLVNAGHIPSDLAVMDRKV